MSIDFLDSTATESERVASSGLNSRVAITVALLATFLGVCKVKDDNVVQAMQQAQADMLDHWNFYQARNIREEIARATFTQLTLQRAASPADKQAGFDEAIAQYKTLADDQNTKKADLESQAKADQVRYTALNYRDDQFDLADALGALAVSLLAVTALTHKRWLFWTALVPTALCAVMGMAGIAGWHIHWDVLSRMLG